MLKEVIFFSYGDSTDAATWSNVPFLFSTTLESREVVVRRISLAPNKWLQKIYNRTVYALLKVFLPKHECRYQRSLLFSIESNIKIKRSLKQHPSAELCVFTNFDFYNKFNNVPTLLFCDWTFDIYIREHLNRNLYFFERRFAFQQETAINKSEYVISLFPKMAQKMQENYPEARVLHLKRNVANIFPGIKVSNTFISTKYNKKKILFIGGPKYLDGLSTLIRAYSILKERGYDCSLDVIGMNNCDVSHNVPDIVFYGYLNKSRQTDREEYYRILSEAYLIVNVQPLWAGYSSIVESMYFYTPVIVTPFEDFVIEFGKEIDFGKYNKRNDDNTLALEIKEICDMTKSDYEFMATSAHEKVKDYTWDKYVEVMLEEIYK